MPIAKELGRIELAVHKNRTVVVGYDDAEDIVVRIEGDECVCMDGGLEAPLSPQATQQLRAILLQAVSQRGDD